MSSLYIDRKGIALEIEHGALVFRENGERVGTVPISPLSRVVFRSDVQLSTKVLSKLGEAGVGLIFLAGNHKAPALHYPRPHHDIARRMAQWLASQQVDFCLIVAQQLVQRKLEQQAAVLEHYQTHRPDQRYPLSHALKTLYHSIENINSYQSLNHLRGAEGVAARCYFQALAAIAPSALQFQGRNRRPPKDPLNAMLSLGYTLIHAEACLTLYGMGFDPYVGFYHQIEFGRESLACDVIEPVRPLVDRFVLGLFENEVLRAEDFSQHNTEGCLLGKAGRLRFYSAYEQACGDFRSAIKNEIERLKQCFYQE